jgi:hypothetical protein
MRRALLLTVVALAGCGGALDRREAESRAEEAVAAGLANGSIASALDRATTPDADGAMGQAGGSAVGITRVEVDTASRTVSRRGEDWIVAYDLRRAPLGLRVCVYVASDRLRVTVKRDC